MTGVQTCALPISHVILIDLSNKAMTGKVAENALEKAGITVNKNMVPFDERSPFITSGIRIGTPAITTRGMSQDDMVKIVALIDAIIEKSDDEDNIVRVKAEDRKSTRLNSSHALISYAVFCLKKKNQKN